MSVKITLEFPDTLSALSALQLMVNPNSPSEVPCAPKNETPSTPSSNSTVPRGRKRETPAAPPSKSTAPAATSTEAQTSTLPATASASTEAASTPASSPATEEKLTEDDVRRALTKLQSAKSRDVAKKILEKHAPTGTIGSLPKDKFGAVISECAAAEKA